MPFVKDIIELGFGARLGPSKEIGHYTKILDRTVNKRSIIMDSDEYHYDYHGPLSFRQPKENVELDLLNGFDPDADCRAGREKTAKDDEDKDQVFHWLLKHPEHRLNSDGSPVDFFAARSNMSNFLMVPDSNNRYQKEWSVLASKFERTIFLKIKEEKFIMADEARDKKLNFSGNRFQRYVLGTEEDWELGSTTGNRNLAKVPSYKGIVHSVIENPNRGSSYSFIMPRDLDGVVSHFEGPQDSMDRFVEVRTIGDHKKEIKKTDFERYDLQKWWASAQLVGIPKIFCGYRTKDYKVYETEMFVTEDIPNRCQEYWSKDDNISFFDGFLSYIKSEMESVTNPRVIYEFKFDPKYMSIVHKKHTPNSPDLIQGAGSLPSDVSIVPDWFIEKFKPLV